MTYYDDLRTRVVNISSIESLACIWAHKPGPRELGNNLLHKLAAFFASTRKRDCS